MGDGSHCSKYVYKNSKLPGPFFASHGIIDLEETWYHTGDIDGIICAKELTISLTDHADLLQEH